MVDTEGTEFRDSTFATSEILAEDEIGTGGLKVEHVSRLSLQDKTTERLF